MLVIVSPDDALLGHIEFFKTVNYLDEYELSYQVYAPEHRGKGVATEAVQLLVRYVFETKRVNRIRLVIHPDNVASRRLAEKCGFRHEGRARGAWYHKGKHQDVEIYALLHDDVITASSGIASPRACGQAITSTVATRSTTSTLNPIAMDQAMAVNAAQPARRKTTSPPLYRPAPGSLRLALLRLLHQAHNPCQGRLAAGGSHLHPQAAIAVKRPGDHFGPRPLAYRL